MRIIARSRIGFWTAFETEHGSFLNIRDETGATVTVLLTQADADLLSADSDICHPHARHLAESGRRLPQSLPTPPRGGAEPEPHEWQPMKPTASIEMLKAA